MTKPLTNLPTAPPSVDKEAMAVTKEDAAAAAATGLAPVEAQDVEATTGMMMTGIKVMVKTVAR